MGARLVPSDNFHNPLGLLGRMLLSGSRAAYAALFHEGLRLLARPLDAVLARRERRLEGRSSQSQLPMLLIVGAPRSGTTLVYQTLSRYLDVSYVSNLTSMFPRSPIAGSRMFGWLPGRTSADFRNYYGQTSRLHGPNDGFSLWDKWLGSDRYEPRTDLSEPERQEMRQFFDAWHAEFGKPFLNKNNRNTGCLDMLSRTLPQVSFVVVRRNPLLVAQSLIRAREQVQGDKSIGWGLHSASTDTTQDPLKYVDAVCDQILRIEQQLDEQLRHIPASRLVEITYEGFCEDPAETLRWICRSVAGIRLRENMVKSELRPFEPSAAMTLTPDEQARLLRGLKERRHSGAAAVASAPVVPEPK